MTFHALNSNTAVIYLGQIMLHNMHAKG